jgi:uncharacterized metal-binding protein YceD (DUF177 family)
MDAPYSELSRPMDLEQTLHGHAPYTFHTTQEECAALARRFGIRAVEGVQVSLSVKADATYSGGYFLEGTLHANVIQSCVVTLRGVPEVIETSFTVRILPPRFEAELSEEQLETDDIEFSADGHVDVGEIAAQYLALSLNPYPRAPLAGEPLETLASKQSPFAMLKKLTTPGDTP